MRKLGDIRIKGKGYLKWVWDACEVCGKERWVRQVKGQPINKLCKPCAHKGKPSNHWKGGRTKDNGYVRVWVSPDDFFYPMANKKPTTKCAYVMEHRLVVAKALNRCLLPWEVVHHRNGIKDDNRLENLELLPNGKYHLVDLHLKCHIKRLEGKIDNQSKEIRLLRFQIKVFGENLSREERPIYGKTKG